MQSTRINSLCKSRDDVGINTYSTRQHSLVKNRNRGYPSQIVISLAEELHYDIHIS